MARAGVDLETSVPALVGVLYSRLNSSGMSTFSSEVGIGMMDFRVLTMLANEPSIKAMRIVEAVGLNKGAVSRTLGSLKARGLIHATAGNGRNACFHLSAAGQLLHDRALQLTGLRQEILLDGISARDTRNLVQLLRTMIANADKLTQLVPRQPASITKK